jgi:hypothetical protein
VSLRSRPSSGAIDIATNYELPQNGGKRFSLSGRGGPPLKLGGDRPKLL